MNRGVKMEDDGEPREVLRSWVLPEVDAWDASRLNSGRTDRRQILVSIFTARPIREAAAVARKFYQVGFSPGRMRSRPC